MASYWKSSKSLVNNRGIFTNPPNNCCSPVSPDCCSETRFHSKFPGPYSILGNKTILFGGVPPFTFSDPDNNGEIKEGGGLN